VTPIQNYEVMHMADRATEDPSEFCFVLPEMSVARVSSMEKVSHKDGVRLGGPLL
jgi:hypothetical protein